MFHVHLRALRFRGAHLNRNRQILTSSLSWSRHRVAATLVALLALCASTLSAQTVTLTGVVYDQESKDPLIGASVLQKGTSNGVTTDLDGTFSLDVSGLPVDLVFSFVGFEAQTITVDQATPIEVFLGVDSELVGEVLVVGYGRQKKRVSTGSIAKIDSKDIEGIPVPDVTAALEGQMSGLIVNESSGQPGSSTTLLIRGISTNGDNTPLFIVDGLQVGGIWPGYPDDTTEFPKFMAEDYVRVYQ